MYDTTETIVATSTPPGMAGRAIVRASGPDAIRLASGVFISHAGDLRALKGFQTVAGQIRLAHLALPSRAYVFRTPRSYTRQDLIELHIPGHPIAAAMLVDALIDAGGRAAEAGEFTRRAFLSGRIDLSAAEAVADVIAAATDAELRAAHANATGALHRCCQGWAETIAEALAEIEAGIDLGDEPIGLATPEQMADRLTHLASSMGRTLRDAASPPAAGEIPRVAMAGPANVGKSSLTNALTGLDRAIVSSAAGTTRDVLTAPLKLADDREVLLLDVAGVTGRGDTIAAAADNAALAALQSADVVLFVMDATSALPTEGELLGAGRAGDAIGLLNKTDLLAKADADALVANLTDRTGRPVIATSAVTGEGLASVVNLLGEMLTLQTTPTASPCAMHDRQRRAVAAAIAAVTDAAAVIAPTAALGDRAELAAVELRDALGELGTITGDAIGEEVLGRIFRRFCVGK